MTSHGIKPFLTFDPKQVKTIFKNIWLFKKIKKINGLQDLLQLYFTIVKTWHDKRETSREGKFEMLHWNTTARYPTVTMLSVKRGCTICEIVSDIGKNFYWCKNELLIF